MPPSMNRQILLRRRPSGMPEPGDFELVESPVPTPGEGEFLCRTIYLSLDPYMRGRISGGQSYAASVEPGQVIVGGTVVSLVAGYRVVRVVRKVKAGRDGAGLVRLSDIATIEIGGQNYNASAMTNGHRSVTIAVQPCRLGA